VAATFPSGRRLTYEYGPESVPWPPGRRAR